ncbi:triggering receptor expressed on myeloid cells 1-like isoform X1 [Rattus norvegicus]|uniref:Natural cytotoxicity triggering receptor 2 like 1 n=1 Tax=Rattus norvegicus TaxID=10116 RepID=F1LTR7_RAT|nr:triggering receptor expressed on myeloid cells 1-like isoform X1 [Rattus norvegicus]|eukprot:XP_006244556.2 PREDICTED: triggering receptor expressed on myeloid cells 1-like isoform X1 [Rattus norvegicus]
MAWEATYLLSSMLLLLLASGSWAQDPEVFRTWEGKTVSVTCWHNPGYRFNEKFWCKETSEVACQPLVSSVSRGAEKLRLSIQEDSRFSFFTVTMTELETADSGIYHCGFFGNQRNFIYILRTIHLVVSKVSSDVSIPDIIPIEKLTAVSILVTTKYSPSDTTTTPSLPKSTAVVSSPDPEVTVKNGTDPTRGCVFSVVPVVCALLIKNVIFIVLFAVTQRSFG